MLLSEKYLNHILHCDCVEGMRALPDTCIPLTVTSPPYDGLRVFGGHPFDFEGIAQELYRLTVPGGIVVWIVQDATVKGSETGTSARQKLFFKKIGFNVHATMIMVSRGQRHPQPTRYCQQFQYAFVLSKGKPRTVNLLRDKRNSTAGKVVMHAQRKPNGECVTTVKDDKRIAPFGRRGNVWTYLSCFNGSTKDRYAFAHPALMPEMMAEDHILSWSQPGDLVFDPMVGAGTTCKMALLNHRKFLGMEIHQPYWELACKRMELAKEEHRRRMLAWLHGPETG